MSNYVQAMRNTYQLTCPDSHPDDFESNVERYTDLGTKTRFESLVDVAKFSIAINIGRSARGYNPIATIVRAKLPEGGSMISDETGLENFLGDDYKNWLQDGNCPPPRSPNAGSEGQAVATNAGSGSISESKGGSGSDESKNSVRNFLAENWKGFAFAGGLLATTWALWGTSAFLVADDVTGVGMVDDPALAVTVPAASAATAATVATVTALAASALLYFGAGINEKNSAQPLSI